MALEPSPKRAIVFFDGQNLYHAARHAFGYTYPNFDPIALASAISNAHGWELAEVRFYTGVPDREDDPLDALRLRDRSEIKQMGRRICRLSTAPPLTWRPAGHDWGDYRRGLRPRSCSQLQPGGP